MQSYTCFDGVRQIGQGELAAVAVSVKRAMDSGSLGPVLIFDDSTGRSIDVDLRGTEQEIVARLAIPEPEKPGRGRPKLGVVAREVTLLPRHWEWLGQQPGGASIALRRLVEEARKDTRLEAKKAKERAYYFMSAMAGDLANFEDASRALFADDVAALTELMQGWPEDVRTHVLRLRGVTR